MTPPERILSFPRAHARAVADGAGPDEALGAGLAADLASRTPMVRPDDLLAGMPGSESLIQITSGGLFCAGDVPEALRDTEWEAEARDALDAWRPRTTGAAFEEARKETFTREELVALSEPSLGWGGGWGGHAVLGYEAVLRDGVAGLKRRVEERLRDAEARDADAAVRDWYRAEGRVCGGIAAFIANHADRARALAADAGDTVRRDLLSLAETCDHVSGQGARSLREAVQLFWFVHALDGTDSPGRLDQYLLPYYAKEGDTPDARRAAALPILDALWRRFIACRTWNVCLAGQTADGADASNELTWIFLDLQEEHGREAPNLSVRFFPGSPPELMERCVRVIAKGSGQPALYNDAVIVPALQRLGIPEAHARDYAMNGCAQIDIQGRSHMGLEDGELSLAKCLELALHEGRSPVTGNQAGRPTRPVADMASLDDLLTALRAQIEHAAGLLTRHANLFQKTIAETAPQLFRSLFVEACLERGLDMKRGGPLYNHGQFLTQGVANCGDALCAIRRIVFEEERMPLSELVAVLDSDWEGREALRMEVTSRFPAFGNGVDTADRLAALPLEHYFRFLNTQATWRGGVYSGGVIVFNRALEYGRNLAAGADGRRRGEPVADSLGPAQGRDRNGPTAMLQSAARLPLDLATSATCLNLKLTPGLFKGEDGPARIGQLFAGYFRLGGQQLQVNVVDRETLRAAQEDPSRYASLVVRVGGYCDRFVNLGREQQDDIIARTAHEV